jgi:hypothetical protein
MSIGAIRDLFLETLLVNKKTLHSFTQNPAVIHNPNVKEKDLIEAYSDHCIKEMLRDFVQNVISV